MSGGRESHPLLGGKVRVYRRENSSQWQCSTFLAGRERRASTRTDSLAQARAFAEDWYLTLRGKQVRGEIKDEKTFREVAAIFEREYEVITEGQRSPEYVSGHKDRLRVHLNPFFGSLPLSEVTSGKVQEYRVKRRMPPVDEAVESHKLARKPQAKWKAPARTTLHHEMVTLRQVLKTAIRHGWLGHLPDLSEPYKMSAKVSHRAWFSPEEYRQLYTATRARAKDPKNHRRKSVENLHDYVLFMANTGLRPDEASNLQYRDVAIVDDADTQERILLITVRGKRGTGYCKSTKGAVRPFERLRERVAKTAKDAAKKAKVEAEERPRPTDLVFPAYQRKLFNEILEKEGLKFDREGQVRTAYSLRHTYICMRLTEGADIYQVAKNCRTSVEIIQKFYASHISTSLNAAAINVRRAAST